MTRADLVVLVAAAALIPYLYFHYWGARGEGVSVRVWSEENAPVKLPLSRNRELAVQGRLGVSTIEVRDGKVRFKASPCQQKICIHTGWLSQAGETAACLPNGVVVQVEGRQRQFDAVNF